MDRLRIAVTSAEYPPETGWGGMGTFTYNLAHSLCRLGHRVTVVSSHAAPRKDYRDEQVRVIRFPWKEWRVPGLRNTVNSLRYSAKVARELNQLEREEGLDLIHVPEYRAEGIWFSLFGPKTVPMVVRFSTPHWLVWKINFMEGLDGIQKRARWDPDLMMMEYLEQTICRYASARISPSRGLAQLIQSREKEDLNIHVVPTGVDTQRFYPHDVSLLRDQHGLFGKTVILYVGRLEQRKGCHLLAQSLPQIVQAFPDVVLLMIGDDTDASPLGMISMKEYLLGFVKAVGMEDHLILINHQPCHRLPDFYALGDVFCAPSIYENFANVILEAMATGLPVVTTAQGGSLEAIEKGVNGLLVPVNDASALAEALIRLLKDDPLRKRMGAANRQKAVQQFGLNRMAREIVRVYEPAIEHWKARRME